MYGRTDSDSLRKLLFECWSNRAMLSSNLARELSWLDDSEKARNTSSQGKKKATKSVVTKATRGTPMP